MAERSIPVDLTNPGQVFACIGLMEAADILIGEASGAFDWSGSQAVFTLIAQGEADPVAEIVRFLADADVIAVAPPGSSLSVSKDGVSTRVAEACEGTPGPAPNSPATLPVELKCGDRTLRIEHWADGSSRDAMKFWAGMGGYSGAALTLDALNLLRDPACNVKKPSAPSPAILAARIEEAVADPFSLPALQSSSFRLDWRRDYVPLEAGFSPNQHGWLTMQGYPLVELLAALGLGDARPTRLDRMAYRYGVVGGMALPLMFHRAALSGETLPTPALPARRFTMHLAAPGKDDRCIQHVEEEDWT